MPKLAMQCASRLDTNAFPRILGWTTDQFFQYRMLRSFFSDATTFSMKSFVFSANEKAKLLEECLLSSAEIGTKKCLHISSDLNEETIQKRGKISSEDYNVLFGASSSSHLNSGHVSELHIICEAVLALKEECLDRISKQEKEFLDRISKLQELVNKLQSSQPNQCATCKANEENTDTCDTNIEHGASSPVKSNEAVADPVNRDAETIAREAVADIVDRDVETIAREAVAEIVVDDTVIHSMVSSPPTDKSPVTVNGLLNKYYEICMMEKSVSNQKYATRSCANESSALLDSVMTDTYMAVREYNQNVIEPFESWWRDSDGDEDEIFLPIPCKELASASWFDGIFRDHGCLTNEHCDVLLNLVLSYASTFRTLFHQNWCVVESVGTDALVSDEMENLMGQILPYVDGKHPLIY